MGLKEGDRVDTIVKFNVHMNNIGHWARATIVYLVEPNLSALEGDQFNIQPDLSRFARRFSVHFDGLDDSYNRYFDSISFEVAAPGTYTQAFDWRYNLSQGDMIDCIDDEGVWYRSTVLEVKETPLGDDADDPQARPIKEVYVAYRYYNKDEGHKVDENLGGKKYVGWSNKYDAWLPGTSPQIQPVRTISRFYNVAGRTPMQYDGGVSDEADIIYNTEGFAQWVVHRDQAAFAKLKFFPDFINDFDARVGFNKLLKLLRGELKETPMTVKHLLHVTDFLAKVHPHRE
jgi:hypothetical protein